MPWKTSRQTNSPRQSGSRRGTPRTASLTPGHSERSPTRSASASTTSSASTARRPPVRSPKGSASRAGRPATICGVSFANGEALKTPSGRAATQIVMSEFFHLRQEQLMHFVDSGLIEEDNPWQEASMISTATARLTPEQSTELTHSIMALIDEAVDKYRNQTGDDVRPVTIRADVFPLPELEDPS